MSPRRERRDPPVPHACARALSPGTVFHRQRHVLYLEGPQVTRRAFLVLRIFNDLSPGAGEMISATCPASGTRELSWLPPCPLPSTQGLSDVVSISTTCRRPPPPPPRLLSEEAKASLAMGRGCPVCGCAHVHSGSRKTRFCLPSCSHPGPACRALRSQGSSSCWHEQRECVAVCTWLLALRVPTPGGVLGLRQSAQCPGSAPRTPGSPLARSSGEPELLLWSRASFPRTTPFYRCVRMGP